MSDDTFGPMTADDLNEMFAQLTRDSLITALVIATLRLQDIEEQHKNDASMMESGKNWVEPDSFIPN